MTFFHINYRGTDNKTRSFFVEKKFHNFQNQCKCWQQSMKSIQRNYLLWENFLIGTFKFSGLLMGVTLFNLIFLKIKGLSIISGVNI